MYPLKATLDEEKLRQVRREAMLKYFRIENWKSYFEPVEFSGIATRERRHGQRLAKVGRSRILPIAAIYGPNASGKTCFVDALDSLQSLIATPRPKDAPIPTSPHLPQGKKLPSTFGIEFVSTIIESHKKPQDITFYYELSFTRKGIVRETLLHIRPSSEEVLFEREEDRFECFGDLKEAKFDELLNKILSPTQCALTQFGELREVPDVIAAALRWFTNTLTVVRAGAQYVDLPARIAADTMFAEAVSGELSTLDTGIDSVCTEPFDFPKNRLDADTLAVIEERIEEGGGLAIIPGPDGNYLLLSKHEDNPLEARKIVTVHGNEEDAESFTLDLGDESDGTIRFIHLIPMLLMLRHTETNSVFVVDELENSMHPLLTQRIITSFLSSLDPNSRRQLIFTTHELQLLDAQILRRDEIWIAEKQRGQSELSRFSDFSALGARKDADLRSMYIKGRFGGIPRY